MRTIERRDELPPPPPLTVSTLTNRFELRKGDLEDLTARRSIVDFPSIPESFRIDSFLKKKKLHHSHIPSVSFRKITTIIVVFFFFLLFFLPCLLVIWIEQQDRFQISSADARLIGARFARSMGHFTGVISTLR